MTADAIRALRDRYAAGVEGLKQRINELAATDKKLREDLVATLGAIQGLDALLAPPPSSPPAEPTKTEEKDERDDDPPVDAE